MTLAIQAIGAFALLGAAVAMCIPWMNMRLKGAVMMLIGIAVAIVWQSICPPYRLDTPEWLLVPLCLGWIFFLFGGLMVFCLGHLCREFGHQPKSWSDIFLRN